MDSAKLEQDAEPQEHPHGSHRALGVLTEHLRPKRKPKPATFLSVLGFVMVLIITFFCFLGQRLIVRGWILGVLV